MKSNLTRSEEVAGLSKAHNRVQRLATGRIKTKNRARTKHEIFDTSDNKKVAGTLKSVSGNRAKLIEAQTNPT
eukprot:snap_masked-scaffold_43-processed-gene-1.78-mRNA-1 protein AED:1.00 eAED:1.00 QI:0/0/0/0/1/1/2/0/72